MEFKLDKVDGLARRARLTFARGVVETPAFMPVGTYGTVKAMTPEELQQLGAQIILGNTFHLMLRPGTEVIKKHGDLHDLTHWHGPILTDSGGFQVFSLAKMRKITEEGVTFASPVDGSRVFLSPEVSMQVQRDLGSDIVMCFDECTPYPAEEDVVRRSMELSLRWAERSKAEFGDNPNALFGIVQGGVDDALRAESARGLTDVAAALVEHVLDVFALMSVEALELVGDRGFVTRPAGDQGVFEFVHVDRFGEVVGRAVLGCLHGGRNAAVARQDNDPGAGRARLD